MIARAGPAQSQEPGTQSKSPSGVAGFQLLESSAIDSQVHSSRKLELEDKLGLKPTDCIQYETEISRGILTTALLPHLSNMSLQLHPQGRTKPPAPVRHCQLLHLSCRDEAIEQKAVPAVLE